MTPKKKPQQKKGPVKAVVIATQNSDGQAPASGTMNGTVSPAAPAIRVSPGTTEREQWVDAIAENAARLRIGLPAMGVEHIAGVIIDLYPEGVRLLNCNGATSTERMDQLQVPPLGGAIDRLTAGAILAEATKATNTEPVNGTGGASLSLDSDSQCWVAGDSELAATIRVGLPALPTGDSMSCGGLIVEVGQRHVVVLDHNGEWIQAPLDEIMVPPRGSQLDNLVPLGIDGFAGGDPFYQASVKIREAFISAHTFYGRWNGRLGGEFGNDIEMNECRDSWQECLDMLKTLSDAYLVSIIRLRQKADAKLAPLSKEISEV